MRATIDLPEDLYRIVREIAHDTGQSMSQIVSDLTRRGLSSSTVEEPRPVYRIDSRTELPTVRSRRIVTAEDVRALDDDA